MTINEVMSKLEELGTTQAVKIYHNHGCDVETYGVSMANLKKLLRKIKKDKELGKELLMSSNADAIYLSQWIVDVDDVSIDEIEERILFSNYYMLIENVFPNIVIQDREKAEKCIARWLNHNEPRFRQSAYGLYSLMLSKYEDDTLDLEQISMLLDHIEDVIHNEANRVRYTMNSFVINVGSYVAPLHEQAMSVASSIGKVAVNMGNTSCKVPFAPTYIKKVVDRYGLGQKRK